ncbi:MAG TPA: PPK2 family polyphosphate kinase [Opitutaceae bacterium]|nr:PPK2 family polyphosphate kinase [Opitutaceae bacterium]
MPQQPTVIKGRIRLKDFATDYCAGLEKEATKRQTKKCAKQIAALQERLYASSEQAVLLLFQGLDASGKDGAVKKVLHYVNPAGVETANFKAPSAEERAHDYLWRVHRAVPRYGNVGVFNRSHYEAVLAERVLGIVSRKTCVQRFAEIVDFERMLVANKVVLLKFYLHLGRDEQAERFKARLTVQRKKWKFATGDLEVRKRWDDYHVAYEEMLAATSHPAAPWHLVPADRKWYRDFVIATTVVRALEALHLKWPKPKEDLSKIRIK